MTPDQIQEYREAFQLFDKDGNGSISAPELGVVLRTFGMNPSEAELQDMVDDVDADGNGNIDFDEFLSLVKSFKQEEGDTNDLQEAFRVFDADGNGMIDRSELQKVMLSLNENLSEEEIDAMINEADVNGDGQISFDEFKEMMGGGK
ncbi:hypothetical protein [Parasitella parasitica]|uniref:EF-hand domain-containing protein n=1 Tax=Parasitella parasitica TaxID=35722 RepID=A0A0B7N991_9FUNG|nr:hypothetical protein [Parasitella parasitica]